MAFLTLEESAAALREGRPVVMPTDTVFGVGVAVGAVQSPRVLFEAKGRPADKPVAWLVAGPDALDVYGSDVPAYAHDLARAFWPGALTLVVRASDAVPVAFQSEAGTIGLRMPASDEALALIAAVGTPLAVTSANLSGAPAAATAGELDPALVSATAGVFAPSSKRTDGGASRGSKPAGPSASASSSKDSPSCISAEGALPSTVVDCTGSEPRVLREGALTWDELKGALS